MLSLYGLSLSLFLWVIVLISVYAHSLHTVSEQVRLDAYTLSLCHQRAHWLENEIGARNRDLERFQKIMDQIAEAALSASVLGPGALAAARTALRGFSLSTKAIEMLQEAQRWRYPRVFVHRQHVLAQKNDLESSDGDLLPAVNLVATPPISDIPQIAIMREPQSIARLRYERIFFVSWPRRLQTAQNFEHANTLSYRFHARRTVARPALQKVRFSHGVASACHLESDPFLNRVSVVRDR